jgi:hypothetical protein
VQRDRVAHVLRMSARSTSHVGRNASRLIGWSGAWQIWRATNETSDRVTVSWMDAFR